MGLFGSGLSIGRGVVDPFGITGSNPVANALGLGGEQGEYFQGQYANPALTQLNARNSIYNNSAVNNAIAGYGNGSMSLGNALRAGNLSGAQQSELQNALATNALSGSRMASDFVNNDKMLGRLYGSGQDSALSRALAQEKDLSTRGFQLQPEDFEAYGQTSGNIARMFGQQEQGLAQSMANRGFGSAGSGVAGAGFSGLQGNKFEQLAQSQRQIANDRMQNNLARLNSAQNYISQMGSGAQNAINSQFNRQLQGANYQHGSLMDAANAQNQSNQAANTAGYLSEQDKRSAKGLTFMQGLGGGIFAAARSAPSQAMSMGMSSGSSGMSGFGNSPQAYQTTSAQQLPASRGMWQTG